MAVLPFLDMSYGTNLSQDYTNRRVDFGEGYSQRAKRLNGARQKWRVVWENIPDDIAETLRLFFEELQATDLIEWTPFNQLNELKFTGDGWSSKPSGFQRQSCSITLMQEFDL